MIRKKVAIFRRRLNRLIAFAFSILRFTTLIESILRCNWVDFGSGFLGFLLEIERAAEIVCVLIEESEMVIQVEKEI